MEFSIRANLQANLRAHLRANLWAHLRATYGLTYMLGFWVWKHVVGRKWHTGVSWRGAHMMGALMGSLMGSLTGSLTGSPMGLGFGLGCMWWVGSGILVLVGGGLT